VDVHVHLALEIGEAVVESASRAPRPPIHAPLP
jgi:hypothetical protein